MDIINTAREWSNKAAEAAKPHMKTAARNRLLIIGGVAGYMAGKVIENIPVIGKLHGPLPSLLLGSAGAFMGRTQDLERRKTEALENFKKP